MDQVKDKIKESTKILDPYAAMVPALVDASAKVDMNPGALLGGIGSVSLLVLMLLQGWTILMVAIAVLYPAVHSIRAIASPGDEDDKQWLTYWMVYGTLQVAETFFGFIFYFIPYWDWLRLALFIWLLVPQFNGAKIIYDNVIQKLLHDNKDLIQKWVSMTANVASSVKDQATSELAAAASDPTLLTQGLSMAASAQDQLKNATVEAPVVAQNTESGAKEEFTE